MNEQDELEATFNNIVKGSLIFGAILIAVFGILELFGVSL